VESERWKKQHNQQSSPGQSPDTNASLKKGKQALKAAPEGESQSAALAKKMRERLIVNFLKQLILFGLEIVKEDLRT
jgi:hypothetical protein